MSGILSPHMLQLGAGWSWNPPTFLDEAVESKAGGGGGVGWYGNYSYRSIQV